jgi:aryl-alcohol dehydrogenase-like predicted oxidoreductase
VPGNHDLVDVLVQQGKVRYIGVSNWAAWQIAGALGVCALKGFQPIRVIQPMYNLVKRQAEVELLLHAQSAGLGVMAYNPLGGGILRTVSAAERLGAFATAGNRQGRR